MCGVDYGSTSLWLHDPGGGLSSVLSGLHTPRLQATLAPFGILTWHPGPMMDIRETGSPAVVCAGLRVSALEGHRNGLGL